VLAETRRLALAFTREALLAWRRRCALLAEAEALRRVQRRGFGRLHARAWRGIVLARELQPRVAARLDEARRRALGVALVGWRLGLWPRRALGAGGALEAAPLWRLRVAPVAERALARWLGGAGAARWRGAAERFLTGWAAVGRTAARRAMREAGAAFYAWWRISDSHEAALAVAREATARRRAHEARGRLARALATWRSRGGRSAAANRKVRHFTHVWRAATLRGVARAWRALARARREHDAKLRRAAGFFLRTKGNAVAVAWASLQTHLAARRDKHRHLARARKFMARVAQRRQLAVWALARFDARHFRAVGAAADAASARHDMQFLGSVTQARTPPLLPTVAPTHVPSVHSLC